MMGLFAQEGGAHTAGTLTILGASTTGPVTYLLHEGSVTVTGAERIRDGGSFVQTGGLNRCERRLVVADDGSRCDLAGGCLWAANGTVGQGGTAGFTQSGGAATFQDQLVLGYEPGSTGTYTLSGGSLSAASGTIGYRGIGEFNQSGGTANFTGELILGHEPGSTGTYALSGGSLAATSATIGYNGAGVFCQTGGTASVGEELRVGYSAGPGGTYELAGGSLGTPACWVANGGFCQAGGLATVDSLRLGGGPRSPITGLLEITQARYELAAGSLRTRSTDLAPGGVLCQMGGTAKMDYLYVMSAAFLADPPGQYELCGGSLLTGSTRAGGTFYQAGGTHTTSELTVSPTSHVARGPAIYKLEGGLLQATGGMTINRGALHQSGGMSLVGSPGFVVGGRPVWIGGKLVLGSSWLTQAGTYVLEDGLLVAGSEYIGEGPGGTGLFVQNGGMHQTKGSLMLGFESPYAGHWAYGRYDLSGGSFSAGRGTIGYRGIGEFNQSGGTANFTDVLILGRESSGTGRYALSGGSLRAGAGVVGSQGYGAFTQSGGTASFDRSLLVAYSGSGTGTYELSGGELHTWKTMVGPQGQFIQTGGLHTGWVGVDGRYLLSGGSLRARSLYVVNEFALGRWADLSIDRDLNFGHSGAHSPVFHAEPFSSVHMTGPGARVANYSTDPSGLADLGQLWMIFEASGAYLGSFEAAGKDLGPVADGYQENFALGVLELAGEGLGRRFTLTDTFDNQPDWSGCEALYLDTLILHQGVMLDPAGLSLYYRNHQANVKRFFVADVDLDGAVDGGDLALMSGSWGRGDGLADRVHGDLNGDGMVNGSDLALLGGEWGRRTEDWSGPAVPPPAGDQALPEPAALLLLAAGGALLTTRRR
ncbi:MAG: hypothetical protein MUP47_00780 [Phycisphaerae bacterium]|nr:hypothetical protein [Phycisphaerae bacterium]